MKSSVRPFRRLGQTGQLHLSCMQPYSAKKGIESWQLPPCSDSLTKHCLRANYQGAIWRRCLENNPDVSSPVEHGWSRVDQDGDLQLSIDWFNVSIGPQAVLEFLSCSCKRECVTPSCQCVANNLPCTDLCHARPKTRRMTLLMKNNPIPLMRILTRSLISVVALNDAMFVKMSQNSSLYYYFPLFVIEGHCTLMNILLIKCKCTQL